MDEDERTRVEAETTWRTNIKRDIEDLKSFRKQAIGALIGGVLLLLSNVWDKLQGLIFK